MSETNIPAGSPQAVTLEGIALFTQMQQQNTKLRMMTGKKPKSGDAERKLSKIQTSPDYPIIEIFDLSQTAGQSVSCDNLNIASMMPIMGDANAEGKGAKMSLASHDIQLDQSTLVVDAGGKMSQQRTPHQLRRLARGMLKNMCSRHWEQSTIVHLAGARGSHIGGNDWTIPLASNPKFGDVMVNPVQAPTYNRHFVANGTGITQGGAGLATISSTDTLKLAMLDDLRNVIDNSTAPLQPIILDGDLASDTSPLWIMLTPPNAYSNLLKEGQLRSFQAEAMQRAGYFKGGKHPLFAGECGMWNGILVVKMTRAIIQFLAGENVKHVSAANRLTAAETDVEVNAGLTAGYAVERCILLGAQALGIAYGKNSASGHHYAIKQNNTNFGDNAEFAARGIEGKSKLRFDLINENNEQEPTDNGVIVLDVAVKKAVNA